MKTIRNLLALAAVLALPALAGAQTSGTLTATTTAYSYSTAPWVPGPFPDGGGSATFNPNLGITPGTVAGTTTVTMDVSPTLSQITWNSPFSYNLAASAGMSIVASSTGLTLNAAQTPVNTPTLFQLPDNIASPISGGGSAGLTKTGSGTITLSGANTYTGGTHINGGILAVSSNATVGDGVFGAAGTDISFDGGTLFANVTGGLMTTRNITLGAGGGTIYTNTATTLGGIISGSGSFDNAGFAAVSLTLTGVNTYTGATLNAQNVSALVLSGNGSIASSSSYDLTGSLTLTNTGTNVTDRLSDTAAVTMRGVNFTSTGNGTATSSETIGAVTAASSYSTFLVTPGATAGNSLTMASIARQNNATVAFRGTNLGGTPGNGVANIYSTVVPTLVGGGGAAGSTTMSILPWAYGNSNSSVAFTNSGLVGSSFVTYDVNGFRPLATAEYATAFGGNATDNVRVTATTAAGSSVTANSVLFAPAAAATLSGGPINITSGAFMYSPTANATGTVSAGLNFGLAEGVITNTSALNLSSVITGSNGVTYTTAYSPTPATASITLTGASTYTGNTTINSGTVTFSGTVAAAGNASVFGNSGTIVLAGGVNSAAINASAAATLNRDISSIGTGINYVASAGTATFNLNGNISLTNNLYIYGNSNSAVAAFLFNGNISGTGGIVDTTLGYSIYSGNNTFTGGVTLPASSTFVAGSDTAFGAGSIYVTGTGTLMGLGSTARTLANDIILSANPTIGGTAPLNFTGNVNLNGARSIGATNTGGTTFSGIVSSGSLTKTGTGTLALTSSTGNNYTGGTVLGNSAGILNVNNVSGSGTGVGAISIGGSTAANRSTLSGNFTIAGAALISGTLSPGNGATLNGVGSIGTANFGAAVTLAANSNTVIEIASAASFDKLNVAGLLTLPNSATTFTFSISTIGGYDAPVGTTFDIADWGTLASGAFNPATQISFTNQPGSTGTSLDTSNFLINGTVTVVPEPSTWAMVAGGASMLVAMMRLRRRSS